MCSLLHRLQVIDGSSNTGDVTRLGMALLDVPARSVGGSTTISEGLGRDVLGFVSMSVLLISRGCGMLSALARALKGSANDGGDSTMLRLLVGTSEVLALLGSGKFGRREAAVKLFDLPSISVCDRAPTRISTCVGATGTVALLSRLRLVVGRLRLCSWISR